MTILSGQNLLDFLSRVSRVSGVVVVIFCHSRHDLIKINVPGLVTEIMFISSLGDYLRRVVGWGLPSAHSTVRSDSGFVALAQLSKGELGRKQWASGPLVRLVC